MTGEIFFLQGLFIADLLAQKENIGYIGIE
jgi:hypothetical protein